MKTLKEALNFGDASLPVQPKNSLTLRLDMDSTYYDAMLLGCCDRIGVDAGMVLDSEFTEAVKAICDYVDCFDQELYSYKVMTFMVWLDDDYRVIV